MKNKIICEKRHKIKKKTIIISVLIFIFLIAIVNYGEVLLRLPKALNSRIVSEVYLQAEGELKLISPATNEGLFVTPSISPSGNEVVFHGAIKGHSRIWKYILSNNTIIPLTGEDYIAVEPSYSWDGNYITFAADKGIVQKRTDMFDISNSLLKMGMMYLGGSPKILNIYVMNSDNSDLRQITTWDAIDMRPTFSPDSKHILFMSTRKSGTIKKRDLYTVSIAGNEEPTLIPNSEGANRPWYSIDGEWIYFWKDIENRGTLCKMKSDGSEWQPLTNDQGGLGSHGPFVDSTGEWLWFHSVPNEEEPINQIFKMPINGGNVIIVTPKGYENEHVAHVTVATNGNYSFDLLKVLSK